MIKNYIQYIKPYLAKLEKYKRNTIFDFSRLYFWNKFFIVSFTAVLWLFMLSILGSSILERVLNPIKFASNSTVILEIYPENTKEKTENKYLIVSDYLNKQAYVKTFNRVPNAKLMEIINSFSGDFKDTNLDINLPIIVQIELNNDKEDSIEKLRLNLSQKVKNTFLDTEQDLIKRLMGPINAVKYFSLIIPIISGLILLAILFLVIYAILFSHKQTIETILFLGMYKNNLIMEFAYWIFIKSLQAILTASLLVIITLLGLFYGLNLGLSFIPVQIYFSFVSIIIIILPIMCVGIGTLFVNSIINKSFKSE
jgi:cell division protein FtsX